MRSRGGRRVIQRPGDGARGPILGPRVALPLLSFLPVLLLAAPVFADVDDTQEQILEQDRTSRGLWFALQEGIAGLRVRISEDVNAGAQYDDTSVDWFRTGFALQGALPIPTLASGLGLSASTAVVSPVVHGSSRLFDLPGAKDDPLDDLLDSALRAGVRIEIGKGFALAMGSGVSARHEIGADLQSALAVASSVGVAYRRSDWLRLQVGVGFGTSIDRAKLRVSPVFRIRVRPAPGVWLEASANEGRIEWQATERFELSLYGGIDSKRYRLSNRGGSVGAGSLELENSEVGIGIRTGIGRHLRIRGELGVFLGQHIAVLDDDGNTVDAKDTNEPSASIRVTLTWQTPRIRDVSPAR
jgi:hypothetical protein